MENLAASLSTVEEEIVLQSRTRSRSRSPRRQAEALDKSAENTPRCDGIEANVTPVYSDIDTKNWSVRTAGKGDRGSPTIYVMDVTTNNVPIFCLYKEQECGTIVFPLDVRKDADKPAFMTGAETTRKVESLDLTMTLEGKQLEFARRVDDWCKKAALENSKEWFGRTCSETEIDVMFCSCIKTDEEGKYAPALRAKMNLGGIDKYLTQVVFVRANDAPEEGAGWEFVQPRLGEKKWAKNRARMVLEARRIWIVNKKFGLTYTITDLAVKEKPEKRATPFANDSTVEALTRFSA